jgi:hypothetical protein
MIHSRTKTVLTKGILFLLIMVSFASFLLAEPTGPNVINESPSESRGTNSPYTLNAEAGNITALSVDATTVTKSWQGYYGNITGSITLDNSDNYTMYDWSQTNPEGEIYASNSSTVTWANIKCVNFSATLNGTGAEGMNLTSLETMYGMNGWDPDGINETFKYIYTDASGFYVGSVTINTDDRCPLTYTYVNDSSQTTDFQEVLLTDNASIIYTTLIEQNAPGFITNVTNDFQILVGEDGHQGSSGTTPYYFFAEIS